MRNRINIKTKHRLSIRRRYIHFALAVAPRHLLTSRRRGHVRRRRDSRAHKHTIVLATMARTVRPSARAVRSPRRARSLGRRHPFGRRSLRGSTRIRPPRVHVSRIQRIRFQS